MSRRYLTKDQVFRWKCMARDNFTCQRCYVLMSYKKLEVHHIDRRKNKALQYDVSNGITYCSRCHARTHADHEDYVPPSTVNARRRAERNKEYLKLPEAYRREREALTEDFNRREISEDRMSIKEYIERDVILRKLHGVKE